MTALLLLLVGAWAGAGEIVVLDAGSLTSPVLPGFDRLHLEGSTDPRARWTEPPDRALVYPEPDPLAQDALLGGVLHLDVPAGAWDLWVLQGYIDARRSQVGQVPAVGFDVNDVPVGRTHPPDDLASYLASDWYAANPFPVFRAGESEWDRQVDHAYRWTHARVDVAEGGLELHPVGLPLMAVVAAPAERQVEAEVVLEAARAARRDAYHRFTHPAATTWDLPSLGEGALAIQAGPIDAWPDPSLARTDPALQLAGCPGERLVELLWLFPGDGPARFEITGLEGVEVSVSEVHWLDHASVARRSRRPRPAFLRPTEGEFRGGQGVPLGLALTLTVPETAARGQLVLQREGERLDVPIDLRVRDVQLAPSLPTGFFVYARRVAAQKAGRGSAAVLDLHSRDFELMAERGMTHVVLGALFFPGLPHADQPWDSSYVVSVLDLWAAAGGTRATWIDPLILLKRRAYRSDGDVLPPPENRDLYRALFAVADRDDDLEVGFFLYDEQAYRRLDAVARAPTLAAAVREWAPPGAKLFAAVPHPADLEVAPSFDLLAVTDAPTLDADRIAALQAAGAEVLAYNLPAGRSGPLMAWAAGADGLLQWSWHDAPGDPFNDVHQVRPSWLYVYLSPEGTLWPSVHLEAMSRGLVTQRYLRTLEAQVEWLEAHHRSRRAHRGQALLAASRAAWAGSSANPLLDDEVLSAQAGRDLHEAVAAEVERLERATRGRHHLPTAIPRSASSSP